MTRRMLIEEIERRSTIAYWLEHGGTVRNMRLKPLQALLARAKNNDVGVKK